MLTKKKLFTNINLINLLISLIPLSLILGNLAININIVLICLVGIINYRFDLFRTDKKIYQYLLFSFFLYLILVTLITNVPLTVNYVQKFFPYAENSRDLYIENIIKSFLFLRFLILFLVVSKLVQNQHFNTKLFYFSSSFFVMAVSIDIVIQVIYGKNLFGYPLIPGRPSSFFLKELIAGGYIQKFSLFFIFLCVSFINEKKINLLIFLLSLFFLIPILLTLNRMPLLLYITSVLAIFILRKKFKNIFLFFIIISLVFFSMTKYYPNGRITKDLKFFYYSSTKIVNNLSNLSVNSDPYGRYNDGARNHYGRDGHQYLLHFRTAAQLWNQNKIFGYGLKSFKINCTYNAGQTCASHPHNYTLEILVDTGLIGLTIIYLILVFVFFDFFKFYRHTSNLNLKLFSMPFFLIVFLEFLPIRSSGSFFSTHNASVIFLMLAILFGIINLKKN